MHYHVIISFVLLLSAPLCAQSDLAFPQLALGGNPAYETVLQVVNEVDSANPIVVELYQGSLAGSSNGSPLAARFDGGAPTSSRTVTLTPFQELTTVLTSSTTTLMNGWLRVRSTLSGGKISGNVVFRQRSGATLVDSVGAASPQRLRGAILQVDQREAGSDSGLAFANPDSTALVVTLDLFQGPSRFASPLRVTLQPNQHFAKLLSEMFPSFGRQQGTLALETEAGRAIPYVALRVDGNQLTSVPVRPLGFTFQYTIMNDAGTELETGFWTFDLAGFNLAGFAKILAPSAVDVPEVTGSWIGTSFQFRYRKVLAGGAVGMVVFNGSSAGQESTVGADGKSRAISGRVTTIGADGQVVSVNRFTAYHKFGAAPQ